MVTSLCTQVLQQDQRYQCWGTIESYLKASPLINLFQDTQCKYSYVDIRVLEYVHVDLAQVWIIPK